LDAADPRDAAARPSANQAGSPRAQEPPSDAVPFWQGHRQRLRLRMEKDGWDALRPHEMLELALCHALPRQDAADAARALLERFGGLGPVFDAPEEALVRVPGVTGAMAEWISLTGGIMRAYRDLLADDELRLSCYREVHRYLARWEPDPPDGMWVLYVDFGFSLITYARMGGEDDWWRPRNVRDMVKEALATGARYAVFVRFAGARADMDAGEFEHLAAIACALDAMDVDIMDCVLVSEGGPRSMNRDGRLNFDFERADVVSLRERYLSE